MGFIPPDSYRRELSTAIIDPENDILPSANVDPTKFDLSSGRAGFIDSITNPKDPTLTEFFFAGQAAITPEFAAAGAPVSFIYMDDTGTIIQKPVLQFGEFLRSHVGVAIISHEGSTTITDISGFTPVAIQNMANVFADLTFALGAINCTPNCNLITGSPGTLKLLKSEGDWYFFAISARDNIANANFVNSPALTEPTLLVAWTSTDEPNGHIQPLAAVPAGVYDDGTAVSTDALPQGTLLNNQWINTRIFHLTDSNRLLVQIGEVVYNQAQLARDAVRVEQFTELALTRGTTPIATLTMRGGASDLSLIGDAIFAQSTKVGDFQ